MIEDGKVPAVAFCWEVNTAKAPEPMLQVARGWAPHQWQAGCGTFREGLQCKNVQCYL